MSSRLPSIWDVMQSKGYSRRDFLQFCSYALNRYGKSDRTAS